MAKIGAQGDRRSKPNSPSSNYARLVERGCLCGTERPQGCSLHGAGDNRGLAAFYRAGMPFAFPSRMTCGKCGAEGLGYPELEADPPGQATMICPNCSTRAAESLLRFRIDREGLHKLNGKSVFGTVRPYPVQDMQDMLDRGTDEQRAECKTTLAECLHATEDGTDYTTNFELGEDGRLIYYEDGPRPSFALALLFDYGNHMRSETTALLWGE